MARPRLATRKSPLALVQAELVAAHLRARLNWDVELHPVVTTGDRQAEWSLEQQGGKGLFTLEIEQALLRNEADLAVHSAKDLPGGETAGLAIAGYLPRADPRDVLIHPTGQLVPRTVATGSPRRRLQLAGQFPQAQFTQIRGNVDTRLRKLAAGLADATVLAAAGLHRLGLTEWPGLQFRKLDFAEMVPAVGQGAIAVQCRAAEVGGYDGVFDADTARHLALERAFQSALGAGCHTAFAAHAAKGWLYFYHETSGRRTVPLGDRDFAAPAATAARLLREFGLL